VLMHCERPLGWYASRRHHGALDDYAELIVAGMHAGFQFHGSSVCNSFRLVRPDTMRSRTSVNQASGSSLFSFAV
jgi:hypothetical protein